MCRELEKWSMEERQEGQRKGEDNLAKLLKLLRLMAAYVIWISHRRRSSPKSVIQGISTSTKKIPRGYRNSGQHQGIFLYKAQQHFFARLLRLFLHFSARLFVFLLHFSARLFVKSYYQGGHRQNFNLSDRLRRSALL